MQTSLEINTCYICTSWYNTYVSDTHMLRMIFFTVQHALARYICMCLYVSERILNFLFKFLTLIVNNIQIFKKIIKIRKK